MTMRPTVDVNGAEYQKLLEERELARIFKEDYPAIKWLDQLFMRLKSMLPGWDYTGRDYADLEKAWNILCSIAVKAGFNPGQPRVPAGRAEGGEWTDTGGGDGGPDAPISGSTTKPGVRREGSGNKPVYGDGLSKPGYPMPIKVHDAVEHLESHAKPHPPKPGEGECAAYVRRAIEAGGIKIKLQDRENSAKDYGGTLEKSGFNPVVSTGRGEGYPPQDFYKPQKGDVAVIQNTGRSIHGHMAMYNGERWISDFRQSHFYPGPGYREEKPDYVIYRHTNREQ